MLDLNTLLHAPRDTPSPLREAHEATARAVLQANELLKDASARVPAGAAGLASLRTEALEAFRPLEISALELFERCWAVLEAIEPVNHACFHLREEAGENVRDHWDGPFLACCEYGGRCPTFEDIPPVDVRALLQSLRAATIRAAAAANRASSAQPPNAPAGSQAEQAPSPLGTAGESTAAEVQPAAAEATEPERPALDEDYIASLSGNVQRKLLRAVNGKGNVPIPEVLKAVYGTADNGKLDALLKAKDRANATLPADCQRFELRKEGETLILSPL